MEAPPVPTFHLEADSLPPEVQVLSFRGRERVGRPYAFDVVIAVPWALSPVTSTSAAPTPARCTARPTTASTVIG